MLSALTGLLRRWVQLPLFSRAQLLSAWGAIGWWERRRILFNLVVGAAGVLSGVVCLIAIAMMAGLSDAPGEMPDGFLLPIAVVAYGVAANVCYTGGWIVELILRWLWQEDGRRFASIGFTLGMVFSVALTLAPAACLMLALSVQVILSALAKGG